MYLPLLIITVIVLIIMVLGMALKTILTKKAMVRRSCCNSKTDDTQNSGYSCACHGQES